MTPNRISATIEERHAQVVEDARAEVMARTGARVRWDDASQVWFIECVACGTGKHTLRSREALLQLAESHNSRRHPAKGGN